MDESRQKERTRTFLKAVIEFNKGALKNDCIVKNISSTGARLDISAAISLPEEFDLRVPHRGDVFRCQLVWREKDTIGVQFLAPAVQETSGSAPPRRSSDLEIENARLRLRIRELSRRLEELGQDPAGTNARA